MWKRFIKGRNALAEPLRGAPAVRRQKTYSSQTGYVYQYFYQGYREDKRDERPGREYVFQITRARDSYFPLVIFLPAAAVDAWQQSYGRSLTPSEQYAAVKMALFEVFDQREDLQPPGAAAEIDSAALQRLLAVLDVP